MLSRSSSQAARILGRRAAAARRPAVVENGRRCMSSKDNQAPTSFSHEKMNSDSRYKTTLDVPEALLQTPLEQSPFSIQGKFREGRAAYLDMSATTPLDPRVLDAMAPYMVR